MSTAREYQFTRRDFEYLRRVSNQHTGIVVTEDKFDMFYARLARRVRALGLKSFADYCSYLEAPHNANEITELVNAVTTNLTSFFRENHHFEFLVKTALPEAIARNRATRTLKIWSAGCSTGEEPYSIAMVLAEQQAMLLGWDVELTATDIDSNVLAQAAAGIYPVSRVEGLAASRLKRFFQKGRRRQQGKARVRCELRRTIRFDQLNLMQPLALERQDIIFCRNVIIYFDKPTKTMLMDRFADLLADDGYLIIGHSESLYQVTDRFELIGHTVYRKKR